MTPTKTLCIDARPLARGTGGIQRYLSEVLPFILQSGVCNVILYSDHSINGEWSTCFPDVKIRSVPIPAARTWWWHLFVLFWSALDKPDVFWSPRQHLPILLMGNVKKIVTIHDLVWKTIPQSMPPTKLFVEKFLMPLTIKRADKIICVSESTQTQLSKYFPASSMLSEVILHGHNQGNYDARQNLSSKNEYFLTVGTIEPRKNYQRLLQGFDKYVQSGGSKRLTIVGKMGWKYEGFHSVLGSLDSKNQVEVLNGVTDTELETLYMSAAAYVSTSLDEGFGLPPQEATRFGLPLLLSDITIFRELFSHADIWLDPLSVDDIAIKLQLMENACKQNPRRKHPPATGYTWKECANRHLLAFALK